MTQCSFQSLPTETMCSIFKIVLESIVEDDMTATPKNEHCMLAGGMPFPHTMALVCRHWRNIVFSMLELWTRISWAPSMNDQWLSSQLQKTGSYPVHLVIKDQLLGRIFPPSFTSLHLQRLKSLIITGVFNEYSDLDALAGYAPQLDCLRLTDVGCYHHATRLEPCSKLVCPALRALHIDKNIACHLNLQWFKNNMEHIEVLTIYGGSPINIMAPIALRQTFQGLPRQIPCLILDDLQFYMARSGAYTDTITIWTEKVILRTYINDALTAFNGNCQTIVLQECDSIHGLRRISLPHSNSLELDRCTATRGLRWIPKTRSWNGDTVTITNSHSSCIKIILYFLGAPFARRSCSLWPRVTTLKLIARDDFVMEVPLMILKAMVSSRREVAGQENSWKDVELDDTVRSLKVLHVHGAQPLPREEEMWFKSQVRDFVWD
ncbi:uncharacterized protein F5147DRAFT_139759 [Suillus discolor]|uniref:F-box domain-containing protein n=1 Tax=Suillus discolor TaxID=1912936 RepID=A0A9P7F9Z1_9AGAM|nr:uncharacterized protein F5147DRAFT_139759 [Suillus discolor]KAG2109851.1 hypothetical protein F5147DRAFT_139759 [Suillus discolor]